MLPNPIRMPRMTSGSLLVLPVMAMVFISKQSLPKEALTRRKKKLNMKQKWIPTFQKTTRGRQLCRWQRQERPS